MLLTECRDQLKHGAHRTRKHEFPILAAGYRRAAVGDQRLRIKALQSLVGQQRLNGATLIVTHSEGLGTGNIGVRRLAQAEIHHLIVAWR